MDVSYFGEVGIGTITILHYDSLEILETQVTTCPVHIPYVPTLLSFREIPPAMAGIRKLKVQPDVFWWMQMVGHIPMDAGSLATLDPQ